MRRHGQRVMTGWAIPTRHPPVARTRPSRIPIRRPARLTMPLRSPVPVVSAIWKRRKLPAQGRPAGATAGAGHGTVPWSFGAAGVSRRVSQGIVGTSWNRCTWLLLSGALLTLQKGALCWPRRVRLRPTLRKFRRRQRGRLRCVRRRRWSAGCQRRFRRVPARRSKDSSGGPETWSRGRSCAQIRAGESGAGAMDRPGAAAATPAGGGRRRRPTSCGAAETFKLTCDLLFFPTGPPIGRTCRPRPCVCWPSAAGGHCGGGCCRRLLGERMGSRVAQSRLEGGRSEAMPRVAERVRRRARPAPPWGRSAAKTRFRDAGRRRTEWCSAPCIVRSRQCRAGAGMATAGSGSTPRVEAATFSPVATRGHPVVLGASGAAAPPGAPRRAGVRVAPGRSRRGP